MYWLKQIMPLLHRFHTTKIVTDTHITSMPKVSVDYMDNPGQCDQAEKKNNNRSVKNRFYRHDRTHNRESLN